MKLQTFLNRLPSGFEIVLADIGSAGGLHSRWQSIRPVVSGLLFEPREGAEIRQVGRDTVFPIGLADEPGTDTLHVTALPNMSSTLKPNSALLASYAKKFEHTRIETQATIPVDTLDAVAERRGLRVDALKVDTQGSELGILRGARRCLSSSVLMAEVEVSFFPRYEGQALLWDIVPFMEEQGFELLDLYRLKRYRRANSASVGNMSFGGGQRAGRLAYGDAIFFLRESVLLDRIRSAAEGEGEQIALRSILAMLVYGKPDMAARVFDQTSSVLSGPVRDNMGGWFAALGKRPMRTGLLHHVFDYLARHV